MLSRVHFLFFAKLQNPYQRQENAGFDIVVLLESSRAKTFSGSFRLCIALLRGGRTPPDEPLNEATGNFLML